MSDEIKHLRVTDEPSDGSVATVPATIVDADGNPIDLTGGTQTTIPQGALVPGSGINLTRGENGAITASIKDKGVTAGMLADGVIPAAYKLPAATDTALGGVKRGVAVPNLAADADAATIVGTVNSLLTQLRAAGVIAA